MTEVNLDLDEANKAEPSFEGGIFSNVCPRCGKTHIFKGFYSMVPRCSECGNVYEKESGYFVGAMMAAYFLGVFLIVPILALCLFTFELSFPISLSIAGLQLLLMQPFLFRYSRIIWINLEYKLSRKL